MADLLGARPREVVFTGGATEAIAAACWGAAARGGHQVVPAVEHSAVRLAAARHGEVTTVPVDGRGRVAVADLMAAVRDDTALVHLQWANHEVGRSSRWPRPSRPPGAGRARPRRRGPGGRAGGGRLPEPLGLLSVSAPQARRSAGRGRC